MSAAKLPMLVRNSVIFCMFSSTSFVHGYVLIYLIYWLLGQLQYGGYIFMALLAAYGAVMMSGAERHGKNYWAWFTNSLVTRSALEYFDSSILGVEGLAAVKDERILLGLHPHGIYPMAGVLLYAGASPLRAAAPWLRIRPGAATVLFRVPLIREYMVWTGHIDAGRRTLQKHMAKGESDVALAIGGEKEALLTTNGREAILLKERTGFVQLACQHGYHLVPTYAFGQNELYTVNTTLLAGVRAALQRSLKLAFPVFWGVWGTPMPHPVKITLAFGKPIRVPKPTTPGAEPEPALVERLHAEYVAEVQALFERHKATAGYADRKLEVLAVSEAKQWKAKAS